MSAATAQELVDGGIIGQPFGCVDWVGEWGGGGCPPGWTFHCGIDIPCDFRANVYASRPGSVVRIGLDFLGDQAIAIRQDDGKYALYGHLEQAAVQVGDRVEARQLIAYAGTRGRNPYTGLPTSTGVHLHFSIRTDGPQETGPAGCVDPTPYLTFPPEAPSGKGTIQEDDMPEEVPGPHFAKVLPSDCPLDLYNRANAALDRVYVSIRSYTGVPAKASIVVVREDGAPIDADIEDAGGGGAGGDWRMPDDEVGSLVLQSCTAPISVSLKFGRKP